MNILNKILFISSPLIIAVLVVYSVSSIPDNLHQNLTTTSNAASALASLMTLFIAILLFSKYGVEKNIVEKQTEKVLDLLKELRRTHFLLRQEEWLLQLRLDTLHKDYWQGYKDKKLIFDTSFVDHLSEIWRLSDDIFLPKEIAEKLSGLSVASIQNQDIDDINKDVMRVSVPGRRSIRGFYGKLNGKTMTLKEFVGNWESVINESLLWLEKHSSGNSVGVNFWRE